MNLRVDLILADEQRSGSVLSAKSIVRILSIVGPSVLAVLIAFAVLSILRLRVEHKGLITEWETIEPTLDMAHKRNEQFQKNQAILNELAGWGTSRLSWSDQLMRFVKSIPANMRITTLRTSQTIELAENRPARVFAMGFEGQATGARAEASVQELEAKLKNAGVFATTIDTVDVPRYGPDPAKDASKDDRIFEIRCTYRKRKFE